jgi:hypothetical protein
MATETAEGQAGPCCDGTKRRTGNKFSVDAITRRMHAGFAGHARSVAPFTFRGSSGSSRVPFCFGVWFHCEKPFCHRLKRSQNTVLVVFFSARWQNGLKRCAFF